MPTIRIFLSSPGDVVHERGKVRELLLGLASGAFVRGRVHIDVVSWDDPHGGATMDARFTPQQAVDRSLPTPAACDLTVVLLWGRMGTPLEETKPDGTPYLSGTEWEFENAVAADTPVLVYRRTEKVLLDPDDPKFEEKLAQKRRVDEFFKRLVGDGCTIRRGHSTYASAEELLNRVRQDVERFLSQRLRETDSDSPVDGTCAEPGERQRPAAPTDPPEVPIAYRDWVKRQHGGVDLLGLQVKKGRPPTLSAIYVPQITTAPPENEEPSTGKRRAREAQADHEALHAPERDQHTLVLARLAGESLYVSGAPGTGKSTFCRWVTWLVAEGATSAVDVLGPDEFAETLDDGLQGRLPLLLRLREFWEWLPPKTGAALTISDLEDGMGRWVERQRPDGLDARLLRTHLTHGSALLVLDGVDEVPVRSTSTSGAWHPRQQLLRALAHAGPIWTRDGPRGVHHSAARH